MVSVVLSLKMCGQQQKVMLYRVNFWFMGGQW